LKLIFEKKKKKFHSKLENSRVNDLRVDLTHKYSNDKTKKELAEKNGFEVILLMGGRWI